MNPILLLHGALGARHQFEPLTKILNGKGREVFALNFSGHGGEPFSEKGFGIEIFADDIIRFLNNQQLSKVDVFGYSMGGYVALWCAHLYPDRVGHIVTLGTKFDWDVASAAKETTKLNIDKLVEKVPAFVRLLEHRHEPNSWKELINKTISMMTGLGNQPRLTLNRFEKIRNTCTILLGEDDDMADRSFSKTVARTLPNAQFHLLPATPHPIEKVDLLTLASFI